MNISQNRYKAQISLDEVGEQGQRMLQQARVGVVGAGGLGCPALTYLTGAGVGFIGVIDHDKVSLNNLPRQTLFSEKDVGSFKAEVASQRLREMNSEIEVYAFNEQLNSSNATKILSQFDLVLDCTDDIPSRYLINDTCVELNIPFVYAGIHRFEGQLSVFNYRKGPTYRSLFPEQLSSMPAQACSDVGVLGSLPGILGTWQANEAMKIILQIGNVIAGKLLTINLLNNNIHTVNFEKNEQHEMKPVTDNYNSVKEITPNSLNNLLKEKRRDFQLVDVREYDELPEVAELCALRLPVNELFTAIDRLETNKNILLICKSGKRSKAVAQRLSVEYGVKNVWNLSGGVDAWLEEFKS